MTGVRVDPEAEDEGPRSRAIVIAAAQYDEPSDLCSFESIRRSGKRIKELLEESPLWGRNSVDLIPDPQDRRAVMDAIRSSADQVRDGGTLLFYYIGHGFHWPYSADPQLHLSVASSQNRETWTLLGIHTVFEKLGGLEKVRRLVILDCCNSGHAPSLNGGDRGDTCVLTATSNGAGDRTDYCGCAVESPPHAHDDTESCESYTAFSGSLIKILENGIRGKPRQLTAVDICRELRTLSIQRAHAIDDSGGKRPAPVPDLKSSFDGGNIVLFENRSTDISDRALPGQGPDTWTADTAAEWLADRRAPEAALEVDLIRKMSIDTMSLLGDAYHRIHGRGGSRNPTGSAGADALIDLLPTNVDLALVAAFAGRVEANRCECCRATASGMGRQVASALPRDFARYRRLVRAAAAQQGCDPVPPGGDGTDLALIFAAYRDRRGQDGSVHAVADVLQALHGFLALPADAADRDGRHLACQLISAAAREMETDDVAQFVTLLLTDDRGSAPANFLLTRIPAIVRTAAFAIPPDRLVRFIQQLPEPRHHPDDLRTRIADAVGRHRLAEDVPEFLIRLQDGRFEEQVSVTLRQIIETREIPDIAWIASELQADDRGGDLSARLMREFYAFESSATRILDLTTEFALTGSHVDDFPLDRLGHAEGDRLLLLLRDGKLRARFLVPVAQRARLEALVDLLDRLRAEDVQVQGLATTLVSTVATVRELPQDVADFAGHLAGDPATDRSPALGTLRQAVIQRDFTVEAGERDDLRSNLRVDYLCTLLQFWPPDPELSTFVDFVVGSVSVRIAGDLAENLIRRHGGGKLASKVVEAVFGTLHRRDGAELADVLDRFGSHRPQRSRLTGLLDRGGSDDGRRRRILEHAVERFRGHDPKAAPEKPFDLATFMGRLYGTPLESCLDGLFQPLVAAVTSADVDRMLGLFITMDGTGRRGRAHALDLAERWLRRPDKVELNDVVRVLKVLCRLFDPPSSEGCERFLTFVGDTIGAWRRPSQIAVIGLLEQQDGKCFKEAATRLRSRL